MSVTFSPPIIAGNSPEEKLQSLQSWLFQFSGQLQYTLNNLDTSNFSEKGIKEVANSSSDSSSANEAQDEFTALRSLIVKTADTINASYEELSTSLESDYVAVSDFGTYVNKAVNDVTVGADGITQNFSNLQELVAGVNNVQTSFETYVKDTKAYIRTGYIEQLDAYGVAIGEEQTEYDQDGNLIGIPFNYYATLTSEELAFWTNGVKIGYFKGNALFVNGSIRVGAWNIDPSDGFSIKYVEDGE